MCHCISNIRSRPAGSWRCQMPHCTLHPRKATANYEELDHRASSTNSLVTLPGPGTTLRTLEPTQKPPPQLTTPSVAILAQDKLSSHAIMVQAERAVCLESWLTGFLYVGVPRAGLKECLSTHATSYFTPAYIGGVCHLPASGYFRSTAGVGAGQHCGGVQQHRRFQAPLEDLRPCRS